MDDLDAALAAVAALRYVTKGQAAALVAEIERLRAELGRWQADVTEAGGDWHGPFEAEARRRYLRCLDERGEGLPGHPAERLVACGLCGATAWQPVVWMAGGAGGAGED